PIYTTAATPDAGVEEDGGVVEEDGGVVEDDAGEVDAGEADGSVEPIPDAGEADAGEIGTDAEVVDDAGNILPSEPAAGCVCATTSLSDASFSNGWLSAVVTMLLAGAVVLSRKRRL
ncbi:MAG: hypothetical protein WC889_17460, partial [Myxococcota bacterium]